VAKNSAHQGAALKLLTRERNQEQMEITHQASLPDTTACLQEGFRRKVIKAKRQNKVEGGITTIALLCIQTITRGINTNQITIVEIKGPSIIIRII